ncbi:MAG: hypothetical protein A2Z69_00300 [Bacteroidetes bacterium RBG_13_44_24]|nr:MAG: hypothetical protein A2Z69_00300 [Bacteroidetes bacterium RBG_13_44_24]
MARFCKKGFITTYTEFTKPQQSPTIFHTWTALTIIAAALGRKVWMHRGYYTLYPNLYTILVSASGVGMKTTAIRIGVDTFLSKACPDLTIMRGSLTIGYLADWMAQAAAKHPKGNAEVTIFCEEFKVFAKGLYADSGLIENLTKLYDGGKWDYMTKGRGTYLIEHPCINMLAASTPEWLTTGSASDFIGGGFSSRIVPVALLKDEKIIAWPEKDVVAKDLEDGLLRDLETIGKLEGQFLVTGEAKALFAEWYKNRDKYKVQDHRLDGFYSKKHDLVLKVAMIVSLSLNDDLVVTDDHIQTSLKLLGNLEINIPYAFQGVAWSEAAKFQDKVLTKIKGEGEISYKDLLRNFHFCMSSSEMNTILQTLREEEYIEVVNIGVSGKVKNVIRFKADKKEEVKNGQL